MPRPRRRQLRPHRPRSTAIGTDRERFDTWTQENADATNAKALELGVERKAMVKDVGYANQPLDGIWLRAPYLHNGSVPSLTALLDARPTSARPSSGAAATSTTRSPSASAPPRPTTTARALFHFDTSARGNGNGGHIYGTDLPADGQGGAHRVPEDALASPPTEPTMRRERIVRRVQPQGMG